MIDLTNIEFYKNQDDNWKEEKLNGVILNVPFNFNCYKLSKYHSFMQGVQIEEKNQLREIDKGYIRYLYNIDFKHDNNLRFIENKYNHKIIEIDDIVITNVGNSAGEVLTGKYGVLCNNAFKININEEQLLKKYLYFILKSSLYKNQLNKLFNSNGKPHVGHKNMGNIVIFHSSLEEQEKIVSILETQENLIDSKKELLKKYKKQRKYFQQELLSGRIRMKLNNKSMAEAFELGFIKQIFLNDANEIVEYGGDTITNVNIDIIDKDGFENWLSIDFENKIEFYKNIDFKEIILNTEKLNIPLDWEKDLIINNLTFQKGISIPEKKMNYLGMGIKYLKTTEFWEDSASKRDTQYYNKNDIEEKFIKLKDDYVFSLDGFNSEIGKGTIGLLTKKGVGIVSTHYFKLLKNYSYLFYVNTLGLYNIQKFILKRAEGSIVKSANKHLKTFELIKPNNLLETKLISTNFEKIDNLIESLEEEIKLEDKKFTYLKQELLSGRIRVN